MDGVKRSPFSRVYEYLARTMRADPTLDRVVRSWRIGLDGPAATELREPSINEYPAIVLTPSFGFTEFYCSSAFIGPLNVRIVLAVAGTDARDPMDLYMAVVKSIYPDDATDRQTIHQRLVALGGEAEYVLRFGPPTLEAIVGENGAAWFKVTGAFGVNIVKDMNP